jgi:PAS domain S-box-containing protein
MQEKGVDPERTVKLELECYHKNGSIVSMECIASPIVDEEGKLAGIYGVSRDITDRKQTECLLQKEQMKFKAAFHDSPAPMVITEVESGKAIDINKACLVWTDCSYDEAIGHTAIELGLSDDKTRNRLVRELHDKGKVDFLEFQYRTKPGVIRNVLHSARLIEIDNRPCILSHIHDITDQRRAEEELKKHRNHLEELVDNRTAELNNTNIHLKHEIESHKITEEFLRAREQELEQSRKELEEMNTALHVLIKKLEKDRENLEMNILTNINTSILPYIEKLELSGLEEVQVKVVSKIKSLLGEITSPFLKNVSSKFLGFTPNEIQVASLIKEGKSSREIAKILNISLNTVHTYRYKIRIKTGLKNNKVNLRSYLQTFE